MGGLGGPQTKWTEEEILPEDLRDLIIEQVGDEEDSGKDYYNIQDDMADDDDDEDDGER